MRLNISRFFVLRLRRLKMGCAVRTFRYRLPLLEILSHRTSAHRDVFDMSPAGLGVDCDGPRRVHINNRLEQYKFWCMEVAIGSEWLIFVVPRFRVKSHFILHPDPSLVNLAIRSSISTLAISTNLGISASLRIGVMALVK